MTDPRVALKTLIEGHWSLDPKPTVTTDWYEAEAESSQVTVSHVLTRPEALGFSPSPGEAPRRFRAVYAVDVWSRDQETRFRMLREVDRIIHAQSMAPGGGLEFAEVSDWRDLDEAGQPRLYRSQLRVEVLYYG